MSKEMYPSNIYSNQNPIASDDHVYQYRHLCNNDNHPTASLFHLTSPCMQYEDAVYELTWQQLHDLFFQQQPLTTTADQTASNIGDLKRIDDPIEQIRQTCTTNKKTATRKWTSKKDRHSKITTARGQRDRRMRLSLPVAQKFFGLQDILGFDKASKTIEWLLIQSSSAIRQIMRGLKQPQVMHITSASECEVISGFGGSTNIQIPQLSIRMTAKSICNERNKAKLARRKALDLQLARESRKIARERARKRTMEKRKLAESNMLGDEMILESWGQFETGEESGAKTTTRTHPYLPYEELQEVEDPSTLVIASNWKASALCNYHRMADFSEEHEV